MLGRVVRIVIAALVVFGIYVAYGAFKDDIAQVWDGLHVKIAEYPQPRKTVWLDQGVSKDKLGWFYHADQGTRTFGIPYEWFIALEQPIISLRAVDLLNDSAYLDRYAFIPDTIVPGQKALPIAFTHGGPKSDPPGRSSTSP